MTMLVDFFCRFGFGMALGLLLTPARLVPPGFFRVNLLVVMGLATFAALLARGAVPGGVWILPAAAAVVAWMGTVLWLAHRIGAGLSGCGLAGGLLAVAVGLIATLGSGGSGAEVVGVGSPVWKVIGHLLSGAIVGLTVHAMLLGHWYLNAPGMRVDALRRMIDVALLAWLPQLICAVVAASGRFGADSLGAAPGGPLRHRRFAGRPPLAGRTHRPADPPVDEPQNARHPQHPEPLPVSSMWPAWRRSLANWRAAPRGVRLTVPRPRADAPITHGSPYADRIRMPDLFDAGPSCRHRDAHRARLPAVRHRPRGAGERLRR